MRTGKIVKHIGIISFATLGMIPVSTFVASSVDCAVNAIANELLDILGPFSRKAHVPQWAPGQRCWAAKYGNSQLQAHAHTTDFGLLRHPVHRYFNKSRSEVFQRSWEQAKGKTLLREWKNPIAYAFSKGAWRRESALSGIRRSCQSHVIRVGSFSPLHSARMFLPP